LTIGTTLLEANGVLEVLNLEDVDKAKGGTASVVSGSTEGVIVLNDERDLLVVVKSINIRLPSVELVSAGGVNVSAI
jgi:hypothetical protein